ncbi:MAG TPA: hypothetical protein VJ741_05720 [Solirubrobacteraceae bacterium]|nr:hypothetical protein [Solirubrobacteraceae bacterium]
MTTDELRKAAKLYSERDGLVSALWVLELSGETYATRADRNGLIWHRGPRQEPRPAKLEKDIAPFEHLLRTLREHGRTPFSTALLMHITGLTRARALGALKAATALGLLSYRNDPIPEQRNWVVTWWWATATREWEYRDEDAWLSLDQPISRDDSRTHGDLVAAGQISRVTPRGTIRVDSLDSSDY